MNTLICFASAKYYDAQEKLREEAFEEGFDKVISYTQAALVGEFLTKHATKFSTMPSAGCVWKPYILLLTMQEQRNGDFIYYSDCGDKILPGILKYTKEVTRNNNFSLVSSNFVNWEWTKYDCFRLMKCDKPLYYDVKQLDAGQIGVNNSPYTRGIITEWLDCCEKDELLLDDTITKEIFKVKRHSRDQSILTNLAVKYGIPSTPINQFIKYYTPNYRG